ncbi:MAG: NUDIX domain-containing protein [Bordetella sp.]
MSILKSEEGIEQDWALLSPEERLPLASYGPPVSVADLLAARLVPWSFQSSLATQQAPLGWMPKGLFKALLRRVSGDARHLDLFLQDSFQWQGLGSGLFVDGKNLKLFEQHLAAVLGDFGWRNEDFAVIDRQGLTMGPDRRLERSLFRWLGLLSESVQLNLWRDDGLLWIAQRAMTKAIDPGLWDAAVAGGLSAGEQPEQAIWRESLEEAGLTSNWHSRIQRPASAPCIRVSRLIDPPWETGVKPGWPERCLHHERVWRFEITLPRDWQPVANDGEVVAFQAAEPEAIFSLWKEGRFNHEAACAGHSPSL